MWVWTDQGLCQVRADRLTAGAPDAVRAMGPRGHGSTIGPSWQYGLLGSRARATGCWPGAALPSPGSWLTSYASARPERPWRNW